MSDIQPLNKVDFSSLISADDELDSESLRTIQNTLKVLSSISPSSSFSPSNFALIPSNIPSIASETLTYIRELFLSTTRSALSNATSSFLAGATSESDEFGDVALYLCPRSSHPTPFSSGSESDILKFLGFPDPTDLLKKEDVHVKSFNPPNLSEDEYASKLADPYAFRLEGLSKGGEVLFVLVGRYKEDWVGIVGVGIWS